MPAVRPLVVDALGNIKQMADADSFANPVWGNGAALIRKKPAPNSCENLLVYYGYPIAYLGMWDAPSIITRIASQYSVWVVGDTYQDPSFEEYSSTQTIINGVRALGVRVYGYVPIGGTSGSNRDMSTLQTAVDQWAALNVDGVFLDEFGFDYGHDRTRQKTIVDYCHDKGLPICANAWSHTDFLADNINELTPSTYEYDQFQKGNPDNTPLTRWTTDSYLLENFMTDNSGLLSVADFEQRVMTALAFAANKEPKLWGLCVVPQTDSAINYSALPPDNLKTQDGIAKSAWAYAHLFSMDAFGISGYSFGSSGTDLFEFNRFLLPAGAGALNALAFDSTNSITTGHFGEVTVKVTHATHTVEVTRGLALIAESVATPTADGLMSAADKTKLDSYGPLITNAVQKEEGKDLSTNDFSDYYREEVDTLVAQANDPTSQYRKDILFDANATYAVPPSDNSTLRLYAKDVGGLTALGTLGAYGVDMAMQQMIGLGTTAWWTAAGNSTTATAMSIVVTGTGTATAANVALTNVHTAMKRLEYAVTTASTSAVAGLRQAVTQYALGDPSKPYSGFHFVATFGLSRGKSAGASRRLFAGMTSVTAAPTDTDPSSWAANAIGVGANSSDANWQLMHRSGTGTMVKVDTGFNKNDDDATQMYTLSIFSPQRGGQRATVRFTRLGDGKFFEQEITTDLPALSQLLTWQIYASVGGVSSVIGVAVSSVYIKTQ
jgi:hypothetical protein